MPDDDIFYVFQIFRKQILDIFLRIFCVWIQI